MTIKLEELDAVEIFAAGTYYNETYTEDDIDEIVKNTNELIEARKHDPPGKLGHDDDQAFAKESGLPAIGWVKKLYRKGNLMLADFAEVPSMVVEAIKKGLYKKVSAEIYMEPSSKREFGITGKVLRAVAFLGADVPKVKGLQPFMLDDKATKEEICVATYQRHSEKQEEPMADKQHMVPANRHPYGALVKMKDSDESHVVTAQHPDGSYDVRNMKDGGKMKQFVPHDDLALMSEQPASPVITDKTKEEEMANDEAVKLAEKKAADATAEAEKTAAKLAELEAKNAEKEIAAFVEKHKTVITPALAPKLKALVSIKFAEPVRFDEKDAPASFREKLLAFAEELIGAKMVKLGEIAPGDPKPEEVTEVKLAESTYEIHKKESRDPIDLVHGALTVRAEKYAEEHKVSFSKALVAVAKMDKIHNQEVA